jgi:hypothetical protein
VVLKILAAALALSLTFAGAQSYRLVLSKGEADRLQKELRLVMDDLMQTRKTLADERSAVFERERRMSELGDADAGFAKRLESGDDAVGDEFWDRLCRPFNVADYPALSPGGVPH